MILFFTIALTSQIFAADGLLDILKPNPLIPKSHYSKSPVTSNFVSASYSQELRDADLPVNEIFPACTQIAPDVDVNNLKNFLKNAEKSDSSALIVIKDGCTLVEKHYGGKLSEVYSVQSVTKSVASLTVGTLLDAGLIENLNTQISSYFPEIKMDAEKSKITIAHLLSQTSGLGDWDTAGTGPNLIHAIFASHLKANPGAQWIYSSMASYLLGPIITKAAKQPASQYMQTHIFQPLGIESAKWVTNDVDTGGGLFMNSRDMLRIGKLMVEQGRWQDQQIVSEKWITRSATSSQYFFPGYGLMWWLYDWLATNKTFATVSAVGYQGQYIAVHPEHNLIVVRTHRIEQTSDYSRLKKISWSDFTNEVGKLVH